MLIRTSRKVRNPNLVAADYDDGTVSVLLGNGDGTFSARVAYAMGAEVNFVKLADVNNDSNLDILSANDGSDQLNVRLGTGAGSFGASQTFALGATGAAYVHHAIDYGDFNSDGYLDIVSTEQMGISVLMGNGDGTFDARQSIGSGWNESVEVFDYDGDGFLDVVAVNFDNARLEFYKNDGSGALTLATYTLPTTPNNEFILAVDINADGGKDLLYQDKNTGMLVQLANITEGQDAINGGLSLEPFNMLSQASAIVTLDLIKPAREQLSGERGIVGAALTRLATASSQVETAKLAYSESRSRIMDVDVAEEAANLVRTSILRDSAAAVLAQANQTPALALRLLQDLQQFTIGRS